MEIPMLFSEFNRPSWRRITIPLYWGMSKFLLAIIVSRRLPTHSLKSIEKGNRRATKDGFEPVGFH
jgi:hypothetical protein